MGNNVLGFDTVQHSARGLSDANGILAQRKAQGRGDGPCAGQQSVRAGVRAVLVRREERTPGDAGEVLERLGELGIVDAGIQTAYDGRHVFVERKVLERESVERRIGGILVLG